MLLPWASNRTNRPDLLFYYLFFTDIHVISSSMPMMLVCVCVLWSMVRGTARVSCSCLITAESEHRLWHTGQVWDQISYRLFVCSSRRITIWCQAPVHKVQSGSPWSRAASQRHWLLCPGNIPYFGEERTKLSVTGQENWDMTSYLPFITKQPSLKHLMTGK